MQRVPKKKHTSLYYMVQYFVSKYYEILEESKQKELSEEERFDIMQELDTEYRARLADYPKWESEESAEHFKNSIDYLTKAYSRREKQAELSSAASALTERVLANMERSRKIRESIQQ